MDKYEYKVRADEIKDLIARGEYTQAADIADTIDWRRVKSVMMLCTISDLYKINRRYEDAKNMLLLAYERRPGGRTICYSLCELCIKTEEFVPAVNYYKEYVQAAPKDPGRYILQYKLYEAQDVSLEERIGVLEELKKRDYREKWAYELAYLYHRVGLATRCIEECDEMILWFGDGKYVIKAMELKMLHQPLTPEQQERYDHRFDSYEAEAPVNDSFYEEEQSADSKQGYPAESDNKTDSQGGAADNDKSVMQRDTIVYEDIRRSVESQLQSQNTALDPTPQAEEMDIQVKTMDMGKYNTINLQAELAAGLREVLGDDRSRSEEITRSIVAPLMDTGTPDTPQIEDEGINQNDAGNGMEIVESTEVFFGETGELGNLQLKDTVKDMPSKPGAAGEIEDENTPEYVPPASVEQEYAEITEVILSGKPEDGKGGIDASHTAETVMNQLRMEGFAKAEEQARIAQPPKEMAGVLSQESDGQISLVMPESETVEKQITGQLSIQDVLTEWERMKKEGEERRKEEVRQRVLQQTGDMFTEFEASVRDGLLEQLENGTVEGEPAVEQNEPEPISEETEDALGEAPDETGIEESVEFWEAEEQDSTDEQTDLTGEKKPDAEAMPQEPTIKDKAGEQGDEKTDASVADDPSGTKENVAAESGEAVENAGDSKEVERDAAKVRPLTREEKELFAPYIQSKAAKEQLVKAIDNISMASYTGNLIITADEGMDTSVLARNIIREVKMTDSNFSGKVAQVSGLALNRKNVAETLQQLRNGALLIQKASGMNKETAAVLHRQLQGESLGIIIVLEDTRKGINRLLEENEALGESFTARVEVQAMNNGTLVSFGRQYAREMEYSIDDLGILALHTRIEELQTIDHVVNVVEVKEIVDEAIRHANRKTLGHFVDILLARRYDEEDMIILTEKDFV